MELELGHYLEITDLSNTKKHRAFICVDVNCFHLAIMVRRFKKFIIEYYKIPNPKKIEKLYIDTASIKYIYSKKTKSTDQVQVFDSEEEALKEVTF